MKNEKLDFYISKIEKQYPNRTVLNQKEMVSCINISVSTFARIVKANELDRLPKGKEKKGYMRSSSNYNTYKFEILEIARFLSKQGEQNEH